MKIRFYALLSVFMGMLAGCGGEGSENVTSAKKVALGESLYHDTNFSANRTMACATCHSLSSGLIDPRSDNATFGASLGDDNLSLGNRNAPTASYAAFSPNFHYDSSEGLFIGGQFHDGRARDLKEQAKGPFLNPVEMNLPDIATVIERIEENTHYVEQFKSLYGSDIFNDDNRAFDALADAIASFEKSREFSPFDSKFDRHLNGSYQLSAQEQRGKNLFNGRAMCHACHPSQGEGDTPALFTDFTYDNLGVPLNQALLDERVNNRAQSNEPDHGLYGNPQVNDASLQGAFKVATLRNIAVTGPYMHNGVFKKLSTVVHFYNTRDVPGAINPETNATWEIGEFHSLRNQAELGDLGLSNTEEADLVAFLMLLTDQRYEHLIP